LDVGTAQGTQGFHFMSHYSGTSLFELQRRKQVHALFSDSTASAASALSDVMGNACSALSHAAYLFEGANPYKKKNSPAARHMSNEAVKMRRAKKGRKLED